MLSDIIRNQNIDIGLIVHLNIRLNINTQIEHTTKMKVVQKNRIVENLHHLVVNQIIQILHIKTINVKDLKYLMIMKKLKFHS